MPIKKKKKSCIYIDIDELKMYTDDYDESVFKIKKEYEATIGR